MSISKLTIEQLEELKGELFNRVNAVSALIDAKNNVVEAENAVDHIFGKEVIVELDDEEYPEYPLDTDSDNWFTEETIDSSVAVFYETGMKLLKQNSDGETYLPFHTKDESIEDKVSIICKAILGVGEAIEIDCNNIAYEHIEVFTNALNDMIKLNGDTINGLDSTVITLRDMEVNANKRGRNE